MNIKHIQYYLRDTGEEEFNVGKASIIKTDGTITKLDHRPSLEEAQKAVGGYIEFVPIRHTRITLMVNEDGKPKGLEPNLTAQRLFGMGLVGNVIVLEG